VGIAQEEKILHGYHTLEKGGSGLIWSLGIIHDWEKMQGQRGKREMGGGGAPLKKGQSEGTVDLEKEKDRGGENPSLVGNVRLSTSVKKRERGYGLQRRTRRVTIERRH